MKRVKQAWYFVTGLAGAFVASINLNHFVDHAEDYEFAVWKIGMGIFAYAIAVWCIYQEASHD